MALTAAALLLATGARAAGDADDDLPELDAPARLLGPSSSSPIAVSPDDRFVWVVNPDNDSVTLLRVAVNANRKVAEVPVGDEPTNLALSPNGRFLYVSNTASGTVSVIRTSATRPRVVGTIRVGTEPYGLAFTPNGTRLFVANARSNTVSVIDPGLGRVVQTIPVDLEPRGVAITNDGDRSDRDEKVYVTHFLGFDRPEVLVGRDDYKEARVTVISVRRQAVLGQVVLNPIANTGFKSNGSALQRIAAVDPPAFTFVTGAFPNQLNALAIRGSRAYVPSTGASPDGPVRFNVNVQALLSVIDLQSDTESQAQTINMNKGINFESAGPAKLFLGVPWAIAFLHHADAGYVVAAASNIVVKVDVDSGGTPTIHAPAAAGDPGAIVRIVVGQNPRGIAINSTDTRAYVTNEVSRDVSVIDLATHQVIATVRAADLPGAGTPEATLLLGKAVFNSSTGVNLPQLGANGTLGPRLSSEGWSACASCHPFGLTDAVTWIFATGPRRTLPLNGSFNPRDPNDAKILNHSAIFDELQDFELNIRGVSGGQGLITLTDGTTPDPNVKAFDPANSGRSVLLDAMQQYVARGVRSPIAPRAGSVSKGRKLFAAANCTACHGGAGWSSSRRDFTPPPVAADVVNAQLLRFLHPVGTFDPNAANEVRANGAAPLGAAGFNPPSLLGDFALGPYLHNGSALTLAGVLENVVHRGAGTGGVDVLTNVQDRQRLADFLASIDASTKPFALTLIGKPGAPEADSELDAALQLRLEVRGPNPIRAGTLFRYALPRPGRVGLAIFDVGGRRIASLVNAVQPAGSHDFTWNGRDDHDVRVASGIYFIRLETELGVKAQKIAVAR